MTLPRILAIETSCDDTSVATLEGFLVRSNVVYTQLLHEQYGGVVPELASRAHLEALVPTVEKALKKADWTLSDVDAVAVTQGPGLLGSLLVGHSYAKSIALALDVPLLNVHHMEAHMLAHFLVEPGIQETAIPGFPYLCLTVSGGHTQLVVVHDWNRFEILGETQDDAVGEAFDKAAKMLSLSYPGGPVIDHLAQTGKPIFTFAQPHMPDLNFSYSGLKTSVMRSMQARIKEYPASLTDELSDWCSSIQVAFVQPLLLGLQEASHQTGITRIALAGGVSANSHLRQSCQSLASKLGWDLYLPPLSYTTDNAAMVGAAGYFAYQNENFGSMSSAAKAKMHD